MCIGTVIKRTSKRVSAAMVIIAAVTFLVNLIINYTTASYKTDTMWEERTTNSEDIESLKTTMTEVKNDVKWIKEFMQKK